MNEPETLAAQNGFSHWAQMNMAAAVPIEAEVRDMCGRRAAGATDTTGPVRPVAAASRQPRAASQVCHAGILVQTTGMLRTIF